MPASDATTSFGTLLQRGDGVTPTEGFSTIAEVKDIDGPDIKRGIHDTTHHTSPDGFSEKIGGIKDIGDITFTINWRPTSATHDDQTGLFADLISDEKRNYRLVFPDADATTWTFPALVSGFKPKAPVDGVLEADVTITVCGKPTIA